MKINLAKFLYCDFNSVDEMDTRFKEDMKIVKPILDYIESEIQKIMPTNPTIILGNGGLGESEEELRELFEKVQKLN
ncbi:hypothetical protein [Flavobacterium sp. 90]|nr:hypothetical protein [Flavobacterium sp. 90]